MNEVLSVCNLTKKYKDKIALNNFSMNVMAGEIVALIGENGAGKTTLLNSICNFIYPTSGQIIFQGKELQKESGLLKKLGILIEPSFLDYLTAEQNLQYIMKLSGQEKDNMKIEELLRKTDLYNSKDKRVKAFSFGMKQRLGLCQSLLSEVDMLVFDEPFVGLDPIGKELFKKVIVDMAHNKNIPILFSSHDLDDVDEICDRVVMIQKGRKILDQKMERKKTFVLKIDGIIVEETAKKLSSICPEISCEGNLVEFQDESRVVEIQKVLLEVGHYIIGMEIRKNNLKKLFFEEGTI